MLAAWKIKTAIRGIFTPAGIAIMLLLAAMFYAWQLNASIDSLEADLESCNQEQVAARAAKEIAHADARSLRADLRELENTLEAKAREFEQAQARARKKALVHLEPVDRPENLESAEDFQKWYEALQR